MRKFRVGYYVEVEVEAVDGGDAIHIADGAMGWWERSFGPIHVTGEAMGKPVQADVCRIEQLYSRESDMTTQIEAVERDLTDALNFASVPISRCTKCKRLAVVKGWVCQNCGHDPSDRS